MAVLIVSFVTALVLTLWVVQGTRRGTGSSLHDHDLSGPQKYHTRPVPRIGGLGIFLAILAALGLLALRFPEHARAAFLLMLSALPTFASGLAEDVTKRVSPARRMAMTVLSGGLAIWLLDAAIRRTDIPGLDWIVSTSVGMVAVTIFAVAGITNAVNIIDGFNGLASMCVVMILASIGYVAFQVDDLFVMYLAIAGAGAVLGFFVWNFPLGLIFLGDGGAYFLGFYVAQVSILLLERNPSVSPMFLLLVCIYPIFETLFSIYRKKFLRGMSPGMPDGVHLHMLVYRRMMRWATGRRGTRSVERRNSMTSPYLWMMCMLAVGPAMLFWDNSPVLMGFIVLFGVTYVVLYWRIVRFKTPRFMRARRSRSPGDPPSQTGPQ
jgi:UDP-N-acetylmuramyl pentapeptide phosphotransferase/UDP-N-acetylglucosamine-1-phosphate transferase